jgi:hypothetical protein
VGTYSTTIAIGTATDNNYNFTPLNTSTFEVGKAAATIVVEGYEGVYDGTSYGATLVSATGVNGEDLSESVTVGSETFSDVPGGTVDWTFTDETGNYSDDNGSVEIVIEKGILNVTANPGQTKIFKSDDPEEFLYSVEGFVDGEDESILEGKLSRKPGEAVASYAIEIGTLTAGNNYEIEFIGANFVITAPLSGKPASFRITELDGSQIASPKLQNIPFDVLVTLIDESGNAIDHTDELEITLTSVGGVTEGASLKFQTDLEIPVSLTLQSGETELIFQDILFTGTSSEMGLDIKIVGSSSFDDEGQISSISGESDLFSVRTIVLDVQVSEDEIVADGESRAEVTISLTDYENNPLIGQQLTISASLGTLLTKEGDALTPDDLITNEAGEVVLDLVSSTEVGTSEIIVKCPGSCPESAFVSFIPEDPSTPADTQVFCRNDGSTLSSLIVVSGRVLATFNWYTTSDSEEILPSSTLLALGETTYYVSQVVNNLESGRIPVEVLVNPSPENPVIEFSGGKVVSSVSGLNFKYNWYLNDSYLVTTTINELSYLGPGVYSMDVENEFGCLSDKSNNLTLPLNKPAGTPLPPPRPEKPSRPVRGNKNQALRISDTLAIGDMKKLELEQEMNTDRNLYNEPRVKVYPNPTVSFVQVEYFGSDPKVDVYLMDFSGKEIVREEINNGKAVIELSNYSKGVYLVRIVESSGRYYSERLIVK